MTTRRLALATSAFLVAVLTGVPGAEATAYRYWTYWGGSGSTWTYSSVGPASVVPQDGTVQGWRFAVTQGVRGQGEQPRIGVAEAFRQFCAASPAPSGMKRVAVVFDFGEAADAPPGQSPPAAQGTCVIAAQATTGARILSQAAAIRTDRGLVCAISGYPAGECAPAISSPSLRPQESAGSGRSEESPAARDATTSDSGSGAARPPGGGDAAVASQDPASSGNQGEQKPGSADEGGNGGSAPAGDTGGGDSGNGDGRAGAVSSDQQSTKPSSAEDQTAPTGSGVSPSPAPATSAPTFVQTEAAATGPQQSWLPLAATAVALIAIGTFIWWRRRTT